ncbi:MAG TPA: HD domain-containing phosphohydrolase [Candidatus Sulfotelmatobacter sp.]|nr:HD domain-containing phosphohydrolase [Candidatus Sulfotelmatobacter sp.]
MLVVVVDDNPTNSHVYLSLIAQIPGTEARSFIRSAEAFAWCLKTEPDLLILDYRMPTPNGLEFIKDYRGARPYAETPIIMITGEKDRDVRHRALQLGASDFLNKPADPVEFIARATNLLALRRSRKSLADRAVHLADEVAKATREIAEREEETINRLMRAAEFRDNETGKHIVRMGHYAALVGAKLGMGAADQRALLLATPMHDIGKVATPDRVLLKEGPLTPEEWVIMRAHTTAGYEMLSGSSSRILRLAADIALRHHEKWDGSGYPDGLSGEDIPVSARIAAACDVFDALVSRRPYKEPWPVADAFAEIEKLAGKHFDPRVAAAFLAIKPEVVQIVHRYADEAAA